MYRIYYIYNTVSFIYDTLEQVSDAAAENNAIGSLSGGRRAVPKGKRSGADFIKEDNMSIPFVSRKRLNPRDMDAEGKYYPAPAYISEVDIHQLSEEISESTTLTPTEVLGVISSLLRILPKYVLLGYKVRLNSFGIFKVGLKLAPSCKGYERAGEVSANDIGGLKIMFTPDIMLKHKLERPEYFKLDARFLPDDNGEGKSDPSEGAADSPGNPAERAQ